MNTVLKNSITVSVMLMAILLAGYGVETANAGGYYESILSGKNGAYAGSYYANILSASMPTTDDAWSKANSGYATPGNARKTCSGREIIGESTYYFGFKREWDGACMTGKFIANDSTEAWKCARDYCQTCNKVEDLTELMSAYNNKPSAFDGQVMMTYCPRE
ncbi:MAG: hypothetical protein HZC51_05450 [Nitrospirae bacterium]|nr:hypothetical protein [Nitrospirota bacterium]